MVEATGVVAMAREAIDEAGAPVLQPALFPADQLATLPAGAQQRADLLRQRGPGRPQGARNKRSAVFRELVLARGVHPAEVLIETYSRPVADLAAELKCTPLEAHRLQLDAARVVLEYVEGKQPVRVSHEGSGGIALIFEGMVGAPAAGAPVVEHEFFQALSDEQNGELDNGELDSGK